MDKNVGSIFGALAGSVVGYIFGQTRGMVSSIFGALSGAAIGFITGRVVLPDDKVTGNVVPSKSANEKLIEQHQYDGTNIHVSRILDEKIPIKESTQRSI